MTEQELAANLRKKGITDLDQVKQAVLESDGHISIVQKDPSHESSTQTSFQQEAAATLGESPGDR